MFQQVTVTLLEGLLENVKLFCLTLLMAIPLGLIISLGSMTKVRIIRYVTRAFVWVIRGTPLMLQLFIVFYVPGLVYLKYFCVFFIVV